MSNEFLSRHWCAWCRKTWPDSFTYQNHACIPNMATTNSSVPIKPEAAGGFDELAAQHSEEAKYLDGFSLYCFVKGARWQHSRDKARIEELEAALKKIANSAQPGSNYIAHDENMRVRAIASEALKGK